MVESRWEPVKTAAMSQLVWYVKETTGQYHDGLVAPLIGALIYNGNWDTRLAEAVASAARFGD